MAFGEVFGTVGREPSGRQRAFVGAGLACRDATKPRLPPGQIITRKWPVLHYGTVPTVDLSTWRFKVGGAVERPFELGWEELNALPKREDACDIHCVTRWSRYDNVFGGVPVQDLLAAPASAPKAASSWSTPSMGSPPTFRWRISTAPRTCWRSPMTASR